MKTKNQFIDWSNKKFALHSTEKQKFYACILSQLRLFDAKRLTRKIRSMESKEYLKIKEKIVNLF